MTSIRSRLMIGLLTGVAAALLVGGAVVYWMVRGALVSGFDRGLELRASAVMSAVRLDEQRIEVDITPETMPWFEPGAEAEYFEVRRADTAAEWIARSDSLVAAGTGLAPVSLAGERDAVADLVLPDGRPGRCLVRLFTPAFDDSEDAAADAEVPASERPRLLLAVAQSRAGLDRALGTLGAAIVLAGLTAAVGIALTVAVSVTRGLGPLDRLSEKVRSVDAGSLATRLRTDALPTELRPIATRLNELFERLDEAFERERRFSGAAAHELRTPVAELRTLLEVSRSRARTSEEYRATMATALEVTLRLERLVASLLALTRLGPGGTGEAPLETVDVVAIVRSACRRAESAAAVRGGTLSVAAPPAAHALARAPLLEAVVDNLLGNALAHAGPSLDVRVEASFSARGVHVDVINGAEWLKPGDESRMFEPFWRAGDARTAGQHSGLGLSVARRMAEAMGGTLDASLPGEQLLRMRLTLRPASA